MCWCKFLPLFFRHVCGWAQCVFAQHSLFRWTCILIYTNLFGDADDFIANDCYVSYSAATVCHMITYFNAYFIYTRLSILFCFSFRLCVSVPAQAFHCAHFKALLYNVWLSVSVISSLRTIWFVIIFVHIPYTIVYTLKMCMGSRIALINIY